VHGKKNGCHLVFLGLSSATISHVRAYAIIFLPIAWELTNLQWKDVDAKFRENQLICRKAEAEVHEDKTVTLYDNFISLCGGKKGRRLQIIGQKKKCQK
jgi:hypothetical protein